MKHILFTFLILNSILCIAQEKNLILSKNGNELWFESVKKTNSLSDKIDLINKRLKSDVEVYIKWSFPDGIKVKNIPKLDSLREIRKEGFCKPLYIVKFKHKQLAFRFENPIDDHKTDSVISLLNTGNINSIDIWKDDERQVLYGMSADCGIIFLNTNKRKVFKNFKRLKLTNIYMDEIMSY